MKKTLAVVIFASLFPLTALAQTGPVVGVDAQLAVPVGNFGDAAGLGVGALLRYEFTVVSRANVTLRAGLVYHLSKDVGGLTFKFFSIPLLGGIRFSATPSLYVAGELGLFVNHASVDGGPFGNASDTNTDLGLTLGAGYRILALDLRVGMAIIDLGHAGDSIELLAGVGYNF